jgi:hypothetical protein
MKAISLWEPWASLVYTGAKRYETRSWRTSYRGSLVICAAKAGVSKSELIYLLSCWNFQGALAPLVGKPLDLEAKSWPGVEIEHLQFGKALCVVDLVNCIHTEELTLGQIASEKAFGNFSPGRWAWQFENLYQLKKPFPVRGHQGFFEVDVEEVGNLE